MKLSLQQVHRRFGSLEVLRGLSLEVESGELFCLLGASGCGKTTLLRLLAGLDAPDQGRVTLEGRDLAGLRATERPLAMVFQQPALWPHRTVAANVGYGLEIRGVPAADRTRRIGESLARVRLEGLEARLPGELSGGQQQRVALARALALGPRVLLLDEPFSHLDAPLRRELRAELRRIHRETGLTILHVTHDPQEALSIADRVGFLQDGVLTQVAAPRTMYRHPVTRSVAESFGDIQWIEGAVEREGENDFDVGTALGRFRVERRGQEVLPPAGWLGFRPGSLKSGPALINDFPAVVRDVHFLGATEEWTVEVAGKILWRAQVPVEGPPRDPGTDVCLSVCPSELVWVGRG